MPVYARERKETAIQYIVTAQQLQIVAVRYLMNEKYIPKKWRYMLVQDSIRKISELLDNVCAANTIFPNTQEKLEARKKFLGYAVINCHQFENKLLAMERIIGTVNADNTKEIMKLLAAEIALLKKTLQNAKVIGNHEV